MAARVRLQRRGRPGGRLGQDRQQRGQRLRPRRRRRPGRACRRCSTRLDYRPNLSARQLRTGRTGVIALALPELDNPYFAELTGSSCRRAEEQGWTVLVDQTDGLRDREQAGRSGHPPPPHRRADPQPGRARTSTTWPGGRRRTLPWCCSARSSPAARRTTWRSTTWRPPAPLPSTSSRRAGRRIAAIGEQPNSSQESGVAHLRRRGWEEALPAAGLPAAPELVAEVAVLPAQRRRRGDGGACWTATDPPDAVFCFNDTAGARRAAGAGRPRAAGARGRRRDRSRRHRGRPLRRTRR